MPAWGFEIEFAARYGIREQLNPQLPSGFEIGTDVSADRPGLQGLELRTNKLFRQGLPRNGFKQCFDLIKEWKGFVHPQCGLHIHFSNCGQINIPHMMILLRQMPWKQRNRWVGDNYGKYKLARYVNSEDHYEIRAFNSTLNLRGLCQMYKIARRVIKESGGRL